MDRRDGAGGRRRELAVAARDRAQLRPAETVSDEFLRRVSHDLRASLNTIIGWAELVRAGQLDEANRARAGETILRHARQLTSRVNDTMDSWRASVGVLELNKAPVALSSLLQGALQDVELLRRERDIQLEVEPWQTGPAVAVDAPRLRRALALLLAHAIRHTPTGGTVRLRGEEGGSEVTCLVIEDQGPPVDGGAFRRDAAASKGRRRVDVGLPLADDIVALHGGGISIDATEGGARFTVRLPLASRAVAAPEQAPVRDTRPRGTSLSGVRILVVDDEPDAREALQGILRYHGASVRAAGSAAEAWELLLENKVDVLLADIAMPGRDGYDLIRAVRQDARLAEIPAAAVTAFSRPDDRRRALEAGFHQHIGKPVEPDVLIAAVSTLSQFSPNVR